MVQQVEQFRVLPEPLRRLQSAGSAKSPENVQVLPQKLALKMTVDLRPQIAAARPAEGESRGQEDQIACVEHRKTALAQGARCRGADLRVDLDHLEHVAQRRGELLPPECVQNVQFQLAEWQKIVILQVKHRPLQLRRVRRRIL